MRRGSAGGERRGSHLAATAAGRRASLSDDPSMPRFRNRHRAWLTAKFGKRMEAKQAYAYMRLGMFTLYADESLALPLVSFALSQTDLSAAPGEVCTPPPGHNHPPPP